MLRETDNVRPPYELANYDQVGTVWGLAYSRAERSIFASAYHKRQLPFGPEGPGAIYRISLEADDVRHFATVPNAGEDQHEGILRGMDEAALEWVGKTSLGDLELSEDESELYVVNLHDRKIYRYEVATGTLLDSFVHGAASEPWAENARPFGLGVHEGYLFHGVVSSAETSGRRGDLSAQVYRSTPDGTDMQQVTSFALDYARGHVHVGSNRTRASMDWQPWADDYRKQVRRRFPYVTHPMPMLVDIAFDEAGNMILGLRDRLADTAPKTLSDREMRDPRGEALGLGVGDIVFAAFDADAQRWQARLEREVYQDSTRFLGDESALGGLAHLYGIDRIAAAATGLQTTLGLEAPQEGVQWYDASTGRWDLAEEVCSPDNLRRSAVHQGTGPQPIRSRSNLGSQRSRNRGPDGSTPAATDPPRPPPPSGTPERPTPAPSSTPTATSTSAGDTPEATNSPTATPTIYAGPTFPTLMTIRPPETTTPTPTIPLLRHGPGTLGDVEVLCREELPPTPTSTYTLVPTNTTTPRSTATQPPPPVNTPPLTATGTPTPAPRVVYLPAAVNDPACKAGRQQADVALVLDMSTSMARRTSAGRTKHEAAIEAARLLVDQIRFTPDAQDRHDQVGVAGFNDEAWTAIGLSSDRAAVESALAGLTARVAEGTRLDLAFQRGQAILEGAGRKPANTAVMIVLTDGLPNRVPFEPSGSQEETVLAAAQAAKEAGTRVFTIGLGRPEDILGWMLEAAASAPSDYYYAPDGEDLAAIYDQIAREIACPEALFWP